MDFTDKQYKLILLKLINDNKSVEAHYKTKRVFGTYIQTLTYEKSEDAINKFKELENLLGKEK